MTTRPPTNLDDQSAAAAAEDIVVVVKVEEMMMWANGSRGHHHHHRAFDVAELDAALRGAVIPLAPKYAALGRPRTPCVVTLCDFAGKWENKACADAARPNERERISNATAVVRFDDAEREQFLYDDDDRAMKKEWEEATTETKFDPEG